MLIARFHNFENMLRIFAFHEKVNWIYFRENIFLFDYSTSKQSLALCIFFSKSVYDYHSNKAKVKVCNANSPISIVVSTFQLGQGSFNERKRCKNIAKALNDLPWWRNILTLSKRGFKLLNRIISQFGRTKSNPGLNQTLIHILWTDLSISKIYRNLLLNFVNGVKEHSFE